MSLDTQEIGTTRRDHRLERSPDLVEERRLVASHHRNRDYYLRRMLLAADLGGILLAMLLTLLLVSSRANPALDTLMVVPALAVWALILRSYGLYDRRMRRIETSTLDDLGPLFHAVVLGTLATWVLYRIAIPPERLYFNEVLVFAITALLLICVFRYVVVRLHLKIQGSEQVLMFASAETVGLLRRKFTRHPEYGMRVRGAIIAGVQGDARLGLELQPEPEDLDALVEQREIEHLMVQPGPSMPAEEIVRLMRLCHMCMIRFSVVPNLRQVFNPGAEIDRIEGLGILVYHAPVLSPSSVLLKRSLDIAVSAVSLLLLAPLLPLIALAIKFDSPGPIFFKQVRVGRGGKRFRLLKFRTMVEDAENDVERLMADSKDPDTLILDQDPRITRSGRFLRVTSLDEIPQLWNILRGEMSLVGPRPLPERDDRVVTGWSRNRLDLRPGLTGPWQVLGRNDIPFREMVEIDYDYSADWSLWGDVKLLIQTVPVVVRRVGSN